MLTLRGISRLALRAAASALLLAAAGSCGTKAPCDGVSGSCLELLIDGSGMFDAIQGVLVGASADLKSAVLPSVPGTFPFTARMVPPTGVSTSAVKSIRIEGIRNTAVVASGATTSGFTWPDGSHLEVAIQLSAAEPPPPGPLLVWREEAAPAGATSLLSDVWAKPMGSSGGDFVIAVGDNGTAVTKTGSIWSSELSGTNSLLAGVFADSMNTIIAVGQTRDQGAFKRDLTTGMWNKEAGATVANKGFWSVTSGAAVGEFWAGDNDGKVWHRTLNTMQMPVWTSEQALPAGIGVYGIAHAGGAVFIAGDAGYVGYRRDSQMTTTWTTSQITDGMTTQGWFQGVWAFDNLTAVAVGTSGTLVRCQGGSWATKAAKIDANGTELFGVWGMTPSKVWVAGRGGLILRVDGSTPYKLHSKSDVDLLAIYGLSETNIYAVGGTDTRSFLLHGTL